MIATIGLLIFCFALSLFPRIIYKSKKLRSFGIIIAYSEEHRLFCVCLLGIAIIAFHLIYYAANPSDIGIMVSTIFVFSTLATRHTLDFLVAVSSHKRVIQCLGFVACVIGIIPYMFSTAVSLGLITYAVCILPTEEQIKRRTIRLARKSTKPYTMKQELQITSQPDKTNKENETGK